MLSKTTSSGETAFPWKLHMVLDESSHGGFDDVISWIGNNAFKVHDPIKFQETIMKRFFNQTQYKSFQRQLNIYGFIRVRTAGKATGSYTHPLFIRGNPDACSYMVRIKVKRKGMRKNMSCKPDKVQSNRPLPIERQSFDQPNGTVFSSLRDYKMQEAKNTFEPTPIRSVSPSFGMAKRNGFIEPTPFDSLSSSNNSTVSKSTVVTCDRNSYTSLDSSYSSAQHSVRPMMHASMEDNYRRRVTPGAHKLDGRFFEKLRPTYYNNVDLDLDTVFDEDDNSKCKRNVDDYSYGPSNGFLSMNKNHGGVFDPNFQTVQNSLSDLIEHQQSKRTATTVSQSFY